MALVACPECAREVSDRAPACPACGCPIGLATDGARSAPHPAAGAPLPLPATPAAAPPPARPQKPKHWIERHKALSAVIFLVAAVLLSRASAHGSGGTSSSPTRAEDSGDDGDTVVTAVRLYASYHANEVQADRIFKGRRIDVVGNATDISKDMMDQGIVALSGGEFMASVNAYIRPSDESRAALITQGERIAVTCTGNGMLLGTPMLKDCTLPDLTHARGVTPPISPANGPRQ